MLLIWLTMATFPVPLINPEGVPHWVHDENQIEKVAHSAGDDPHISPCSSRAKGASELILAPMAAADSGTVSRSDNIFVA